AGAADRRIVLRGEDRHLLAHEQSAGFVVVDVDLRFAEDGSVRRFAKELDKIIQIDCAADDARPDRCHEVRGRKEISRGCGWIVDNRLAPETLLITAAGVCENRIVEIVAGEYLAAIG